MVLVSNPSITYFVFEKVKALYLRVYKKTALGPLEVFLVSALAKSIATMITYPFIFVRTSMIATKKSAEKEDIKGKSRANAPAAEKKKGMTGIIKTVLAREGPSGLYKVNHNGSKWYR